MAANWQRKITWLRRLIAEVGPLWPRSTKLSGYGEEGPYHCEDCEFAKGKKQGDLFKDDKGRGRCLHAVVIADDEVKKDPKMNLPIINLEKGCCEFVSQPGHGKEHEEGKE